MALESEYQFEIKRVPDTPVISLRRSIPARDIGSLVSELSRKLRWPPSGPPGAVYHDNGSNPLRVDVEVMFPVPAGWNKVIPGGEVACATYVGPYTGIWKVSKALRQWVEDSGLKPAGTRREIYVLDPLSGVEPDQYVTEIQIPLEVPPPSARDSTEG